MIIPGQITPVPPMRDNGQPPHCGYKRKRLAWGKTVELRGNAGGRVEQAHHPFFMAAVGAGGEGLIDGVSVVYDGLTGHCGALGRVFSGEYVEVGGKRYRTAQIVARLEGWIGGVRITWLSGDKRDNRRANLHFS